MKITKAVFINCILFSFISGQNLCPPAYLNTLFYNEQVNLYWDTPDTANYGEIFFDECFEVCSTASSAMDILWADDNNSGGWFRDSAGDSIDCASGMFPCSDGGSDHFSAFAHFTDSATVTADSRLVTPTIDLTSYTTAHIEFVEAYEWSIDASDSNMVEVSIDGGQTWEVVYSSFPWEVGDDVWFMAGDISEYAGNEIIVAFRYYDSVGYGESWLVDNIRVWGGNGTEPSLCGTFEGYNIYQDGALIGNTNTEEYVVTDLENGTTYCFEVTAVYTEDESTPCVAVCTAPMGPFQVNPLWLNFDEMNAGEYQEMTLTVQNFDTLDYEYEITSLALAEIELAIDLLVDPMEGSFSTFFDPGGALEGEWWLGDSAFAESIYLVYPEPWDGGQFAFLNDDMNGDGADPTDSWLISNEVIPYGIGPVFLLADIFFPNPDGICATGNLYSDDGLIHVSTDDGTTWAVVDSVFSTGWNWQRYMYNLSPYIGDAASFKVAFQYHDCNGNWGYGIGVDDIMIKEGDQFTWLTVSPRKGTTPSAGSYNDSITVTVGVYALNDGFTGADDIIVEAGENEITVQVGVGVQVAVDESGDLPRQFALHQNYPNPFNPETMIWFDVAEKTDVAVSVYNVLGQKVSTLLYGTMDAGIYQVKWKGLMDSGEQLPSGLYFYELKSPLFNSVKKMVLVR